MGYIYASAIVLVCIAIVLVFLLIKHKNDKKLNQFKREKYAAVSEKTKDEVKKSKKVAEETKQEVQLENFTFAEKEEEKQKEEPEEIRQMPRPMPRSMPRPMPRRPIMPIQDEDDDDEEEIEIDDKKIDLTEDFKKYEEFLKENDINLDELDKLDEEKEEKDENFDDDLEDLDLKIEDFAGKSDDEIREVVKKYPPHLQEIILKELLGDDE